MAIESIETTADLDRFVSERIAQLGVADISGLPDQLAAGVVGKVERFPSAEDLELGSEEGPEEGEAIPGILFAADVAMGVYASVILDIEGGIVLGRLLVNGVAQPQAVIGSQDATSRGTFAQDYALELAAGDVLTLEAVVLAGAIGKVYAGHTALTIVRVS